METRYCTPREFCAEIRFYTCSDADLDTLETFVTFVKSFINYIFKEDMNGHFFYSIGPLLTEHYNLISNPVGKQVLDSATKYCGSNTDEDFCPKFTTKKSQCTEFVTAAVPENAYRSCRRYSCRDDKQTTYNDDYRLAVYVACLMKHLENDTFTKEVFKGTACYLEEKFTNQTSSGRKIDTYPIIQDLNHLCNTLAN